MSTTETRYRRVMDRAAELADLNSAAALLSWDQETKMPPKGVDGRSQVLASLAGVLHEKLTHPGLGEDLEHLGNGSDLDPGQKAQVLEFTRMRSRAVRIPASLVKALAEASSRGPAIWSEAKPANDFPSFAPILEELVRLKREEAEAVGYEDHPYDALFDEYEPEGRTAEVTPILENLRDFLVPRVREIAERGAPRPAFLEGPFEHDRQDRFGRYLVDLLGFDLDAGRLDVSNHPFTSGIHAGDVRLTTRYQDDLSVGLFGTLHETGHGLYEQNLPAADRRTPLGPECSLGIHESQSRLWENNVGRSLPFWRFAYPRLQREFSGQLEAVSLEEFHRAINHVEPSLIRIEADEVTYNLHIVIRFELETAIMEGSLQVRDLPGAWNEKYRDYLGITPPTDTLGVMQDIHWSAGMIGYFPTYTLGNLYAAQLYDAAERALPDLSRRIEEGDLLSLKDWLVENVHRWGRRMRAPELMKTATGAPPSAEPFTRYIVGKFGPLYGIEA